MRAKGIECLKVKELGYQRGWGRESLEAKQEGVRSLARLHREGRTAVPSGKALRETVGL